MYGPENSFPISLNVKIGIWLEACIQYQEAIIVNGEYVTQTKETFESIGYYNEFGNIEKGTVKLQKKEIYNGKFSPLINYLNSQAKKIPIAKNSASRWVSNGKGGYTKEFFTPTAVPGIYIIITSDEQQYAPSEFIDVTFDLEAVQKYFTSKGVNYRDYQL